MKKIFLTGLLLGFASIIYAIDFSVEARTDMFYTSYIKNSAYTALAAMQTLIAVDAFEKIRLKAKAGADQVKFDFDGRIYIKPGVSTLDYTVDSAYFSYENGPFVLYAGKQRLKWGTGYFWNPTDNLQPAKDIFRTTEDLEGIYAIRGEFSTDIITPSITIMRNTLNNSAELYEDFNGAVRLYSLAGTCDIYLDYIYKREGDSYGAAISWDLGLFVLNAEAAAKQHYDMAAGGRQYLGSYVAGLSKILSDEFSVAAEYYINDGGMSNAGYSALADANGFVPGMSKRDYCAYSASYTLDQRFALSLTGMHCLNDGTSYVFPSFGYVESQNFDIQLSLLENLTAPGTREGRNSTPVYSAVELRINAYF